MRNSANNIYELRKYHEALLDLYSAAIVSFLGKRYLVIICHANLCLVSNFII